MADDANGRRPMVGAPEALREAVRTGKHAERDRLRRHRARSARQLAEIVDLVWQTAVVVGGGNIWPRTAGRPHRQEPCRLHGHALPRS